MVATGSGLAPFISIIKELDGKGKIHQHENLKVTLLHGHRTIEDLAYVGELSAIENAGRLDLFYFPSVTRYTPELPVSSGISTGRLGGFLNDALSPESGDLEPSEPGHYYTEEIRNNLRERLKDEGKIIVVCGNPDVIKEIDLIARRYKVPCVSEIW